MFKFINEEEAMIRVKLNREELNVFDAIKEAGDRGISKTDFKKKLPNTANDDITQAL